MRSRLLRVVYAFAPMPWLGVLLGGSGFGNQPMAPTEPPEVVLATEGRARLPILEGSVPEPAAELERYIERMSGADFERAPAKEGIRGIHVGLAEDFPWLPPAETDDLGREGFLVRSDERGVVLAAREAPGLYHAVYAFLESLGCRWFFPGETWEIIPERPAVRGAWNLRESPSFPTQRHLWYGFGAYPSCAEDLAAWYRHNRMGGPIAVSIGHTWHGLDPDKDFATHPEWFALVEGKRQPSKPCYSHPDVLVRAVHSTLEQAAKGTAMISMSPPDGLGYCECDRCLSVLEGGEPFREHSAIFGRRPDGVLVNVTSETLFSFVNRVAEAVHQKYPDVLVGCYAYSAYSHPPSFDLHPSVYLQVTSAFRRTSLSLEEQLAEFGRKTSQLGIREYFSVFQWDWDYPDPGRLRPQELQTTFRFYRDHGIMAVNGEASSNWAPRGLGYYLVAKLLWNVDADVSALTRDFYTTAFGPAAGPMERYYSTWYGATPKENAEPLNPLHRETLLEAYRDLDEAGRLVGTRDDYRERVDQLRAYLHYLVLRYRLELAGQAGDTDRILEAIREETIFGGRITRENLVHGRALLGKAFLRRFRKHEGLLAGVPEAQKAGEGWRQLGDPPMRDELERLWAEDRALLEP